MGTNTTGIACGLLNREYIGIEVDPVYYQEALDRTNEYLEENMHDKENANGLD